MRPHIKVMTLGVSDLKRSLAFYRDGLDLPTEGVIGEEFEEGAAVFFTLKDGLVLALYPTASLAKRPHNIAGPPPPTTAARGGSG